MAHRTGPILTLTEANALRHAQRAGDVSARLSLDLGRGQTDVQLAADHWRWRELPFPYLDDAKPRTIYYWDGDGFAPLQRFSGALIKLVATEWGAPTFEIDGIKMLPTAQLSPFVDAERKVQLIKPQGKIVLDCCGGLGYFAACCLAQGARQILSFEKNPSVLWLRQHNPWSPDPDAPEHGGRLQLEQGDISELITALPDQSVDAILHDPPRFGIAGELYALCFYQQLARVIRPGGTLFHYTGMPNLKTSGRDVPAEVMRRLTQAGFTAERKLDGVLATRRRR
ncbi:SAM-dependent methyltransferase [Ahniella affigens]|uniref:SAM-dependent methyltransferase n=1 Tax=Ahniella affigens TaxID=2021234 RepID=A0A2P1PVE2_9GAMM|nr:MnmC family methyltransferase [Ahniella affigens]AVP98825.1 SAM-dependent methyltransferase [Ahniella affigens]